MTTDPMAALLGDQILEGLSRIEASIAEQDRTRGWVSEFALADAVEAMIATKSPFQDEPRLP